MATIDPKQWQEWDERIRDKFFWNDPTYESVEFSEMRMDEERPWPLVDEFKELALSYADKLLEPALSVDCWTEQQTLDHIEMKKTPSAPWRYLGYRTRQDFFDSPIWISMKDSVEEHEAVGHIYRVVPKDAWADVADFHKKKTRTFLVPGCHVLYQQLRCYGAGTEAIKNYSWSKYGFNPFSGNVNRMACRILMSNDDGTSVWPIREWHDVEGYDRFIFLHNVAERRYRFFMQNPRNRAHGPFARWVSDGLKRSIIIMSNGDVVIRKRGNNSGSGMTTANNIEAGIEVMTDLLIYAYYQKNHRMPSFEEVYDQLVHLYGDDNLAALAEAFSWFLHTELIRDRLLYYHGLRLKLQGGGRDTPLNELSFLGFTFFRDGQFWLPAWNIDRLILPLTYQNGTTRLVVFLQRFYSILILSYAHKDEWERIRSTYLRVLAWCQIHSGDPEVKTLVRLGAPTRAALQVFYLGLEAGGLHGWPNKDNAMEKIEDNDHDRDLEKDFDPHLNYKGMMLDYMAKKRIVAPTMTVTATGPAHQLIHMGSMVKDGKHYTSVGACKKDAEQILAYKYMRQTAPPKADVTNYMAQLTEAFAEKVAVNEKMMEDFLSKTNSKPLQPHTKTEVWMDRTPMRKVQLPEPMTVLPFPPRDDYNVVPPENETVDRRNAFWMQLVANMRVFSQMTPEEQIYSPMYTFFGADSHVDTRTAAARMATMFKQGSFNPYGNQQMAAEQYTLTRPTIVKVGNLYTCNSTNLVPNPVNITGQGDTNTEAFDDWRSKVNEYVDNWAPAPPTSNLRTMFNCFRKMPRPAGTFLLNYIWDYPEEQAFQTFWDQFKEGGFNPYGNGQTSPMSFSDWQRMNSQALAGVNREEQKKRYQNYVAKKHAAAKNKTAVPRSIKPANTMPRRNKLAPRTEAGNNIHPIDEQMKIKLSGCAQAYMTALTNPWYWVDGTDERRMRGLKFDKSMNPCIPMFPAIKTRKFWARAQGTWGIQNANDTGWILFAPWRLANNYATNNNADATILYSTTSVPYTATAFPTCDTGTSWTDGAQSLGTDYTTASLVNSNGVGIQLRVVGASIRVQYQGNPLSVSGYFERVTDQDHATLSNQSQANFSKYETYTRRPVSADMFKNNVWFQNNYSPVHMEDYQFQPDVGANALGATAIFRNHFMGIFLTGAPPGLVFAFDAVVHFEVIGRGVTGKTDTPCDPLGTAVASSVLKGENMKTMDDHVNIKALAKAGADELTATGLVPAVAKMVPKVLETAAQVLV